MALKLEQEGAGVRLELRLPLGCQHQLIKEFGIEKPWISLTGPGSIAWLVRIDGNGDLFPDLKTHLKMLGDLMQISPELIGCRGAVKGGIVADCSK